MLKTLRVSPHRVTHPHRLTVFVILLLVFGVLSFQGRATWGSVAGTAPQFDPTQPQVGLGIPQAGANAPRSAASSTKPGSLLFFPKYTSDISSANTVNTLLTITNTNPRDAVSVRVFFVHDCIVDDVFVTLVANQSRTLTASRESTGQTGYAIAAAVNSEGLPTQFNWLIGAANMRDGRGHEAAYNAFAVAKRSAGSVRFNAGGGAADIVFDNSDYDRLPKRVAIDSLQNQDEAAGPAVNTDIAIFSPMRDLSVTPTDLFKLVATAYDGAGKAYPEESEFNCALYGGVTQIWTEPPFSSIIGVNRSGWAGFTAQNGAATVPVIGLSLTDGASSAMHDARVMQTLEWLDSFRMTIPIRLPDNPVAGVVTQDQPDSNGATGAGESKAGSILLFPRFVSGDHGASQIHLSNTNPNQKVRLRVFFSGLLEPAQVKETVVTLQPQQTVALQANEHAPNQRGWVMAMAIDDSALPIQFNHLIGSVQVSETSGLRASFNALAIAKNDSAPVERGADLTTADLLFDDTNYDRLPATTAMAFVPSQVDNATFLGFSRAPGSLLDPNTRALASVMLYDELLAGFGASLSRTEARLDQIRPSALAPPIASTLQPGQHGWLALFSNTPVLSWSLNLATRPFAVETNGNWRGGFSGDGNLHILTSAESFTMKVPATNTNNRPPVAVVAPLPATIQATSKTGAEVKLDASGSRDPDGDPMLFSWYDSDTLLGRGAVATVRLAVGVHSIKLTIFDGKDGLTTTTPHRIEVLPRTLTLTGAAPNTLDRNTTATLTITGAGFNARSTLQFGKEGISVTRYTSIEEDKIVAVISINASATPGYRDVYVANPNGGTARLRSGLFVSR